MKAAPKIKNEEARIECLKAFKVLDTQAESFFDEITKVASQVCETEIALMSLVDTDRQWFKSKVGLDASETPRDISFCGHAIEGREIFVVENALEDTRFKDNPLVLKDPNIRFYAGAPLITTEGHAIGTLCVISPSAKQISKPQKEILVSLSKQIIDFLEQRQLSIQALSLQKELAQTQAQKEKMVDVMLEGFVVQEESGAVIEHNKAASRILGLTEEQLLGLDSMDPRWRSIQEDGSPFLGEDHPAMVVLRTGKPVKDKVMGVHSPIDGLKWIKINSAPLETPSGLNAITTFTDITNEISNKKGLADNRTYLELALEGAELGIWDWYLEDNRVRFDSRWASMLGLDVEKIEMTLTTWEDRVHPDDLAACYADIKAYMDGKADRYENIHRMKHADGRWVYILDKGRFSDWDADGKPTRFTGTHLDITDRMERTKDIEYILDIMKVGIWKWDIKNDKLEWDDSNYKVFGINKDDFSGAYESWERSLDPDFKDQVVLDLNDALQGKKDFNTTFKILLKDGSFRYIGGRGEVSFDKDGQAEFMEGINWDKTKEHLDLIELEKQKAISQHKSRLASIGELSAGVGHEINNPLAIAKGYLFMLEKKFSAVNTEDSDLIFKISKALDRVAKIVKGLKTFSRADTEEQTYFRAEAPILDSINMVADLYRKEGISVKSSLDFSSEAYLVLGNQGQLQQVFMNLLSNAKDAVESSSKKEISIKGTVEDGQMKVYIADTGCGIDNEVLGKIFDPFFTTKEVSKGTGIGLSLAYNFITDIGGDITVHSGLGKGTTFCVKTPVIQSTESLSTAPVELGEPSKGLAPGAKILLVDDEVDLRSILVDMFEGLGASVVSASDGKEALELFEKSPSDFNMIVSDMKMPEMDGIELLKRVRDSGLEQPKFIFLTGDMNFGYEGYVDDKAYQFEGCLQKPFDRKSIRKLLASLSQDQVKVS